MTIELPAVAVFAWIGVTGALLVWNIRSQRRANTYRRIAEDCAEHDSRTIGVIDDGCGSDE